MGVNLSVFTLPDGERNLETILWFRSLRMLIPTEHLLQVFIGNAGFYFAFSSKKPKIFCKQSTLTKHIRGYLEKDVFKDTNGCRKDIHRELRNIKA